MSKNDWDTIYAKGINWENKSFDFLFFINKENAIIAGSAFTNEDIVKKSFNNYKAVLYVTKNGGTDWSEKIFGRGKFTSYSKKDGFVFVTTSSPPSDSAKTSPFTSAGIYLSKDSGSSWSELSKLNEFYIRNIFALSEGEIYIIGKREDESSWTVRKTIDRGITWTEISKVSNDIGSPVELNKFIFYLSGKEPEKLMKLSLLTGKTENIDLVGANEFKPGIINSSDKDLYLTGRSGNQVSIYKLDTGNSIIKYVSGIKDTDEFPVSLHSNNENLLLFAGQRNTIGVIYFVYSYRPETNSWNKTEVPSSNFSPFSFIENEVWGYSYGGKFYRKRF